MMKMCRSLCFHHINLLLPLRPQNIIRSIYKFLWSQAEEMEQAESKQHNLCVMR